MRQRDISFLNKKGEAIAGVLRIPLTQEEAFSGTTKKFPIAIICHDFMQNQNFGLIVDLFSTLSYSGFLTLKFDFTGNGLSEGDFKYSTISKQRQDLTAAIDYMFDSHEADINNCLIIGHGTGANVALLEAAEDKRITSIALIEPYFNFDSHIKSYFGRFVEELKLKGETCLEGGRYIKKDYLDDLQRQKNEEAVDKIKIPVFLAHGTLDYRVPEYDVRMIYLRLKTRKTIEIIENANHDYTNIKDRKFLIELLTNWIKKTFK